jgi:hypothetical protein
MTCTPSIVQSIYWGEVTKALDEGWGLAVTCTVQTAELEGVLHPHSAASAKAMAQAGRGAAENGIKTRSH